MLGSVARSTERETVVLDGDDSATILDDAPRTLAHSDAPLAPGTHLGRYEIIEELGRGGMGVVYRAHDPALDRTIALKRLHRRQLGRRARERLAREAQAMARLSHPNVVAVYDVSTEGGELLVAMEYVRGPTLQQWLKTPRPWAEVLEVLLDAGRGLVAAHERGLVHRDFKPGNVLLGTDGRVRVLDFGIAVIGEDPSTLDTHDGESLEESAQGVPSTLTATGAVMGTPAYMAPEQHGSRVSDPRIDQYAFCVTMWEGLVGCRPYGGEYADVVRAKYQGPPPWPEGSPVPRTIVRAIERGLAVEPSARWPDVTSLLEALQPAPARRWTRALTLGAGAIAIGTFGWMAASPEPCERAEEGLAEIWDDDRATRAEQALRASAVDYAEGAWPGVQGALDAYASEWSAQWSEACRATHVEQTQSSAVLDLRMACLDRRREVLRTTVDALLAVGPDDARAILLEVADLPSVTRCGDVEALEAQLPPPEDPQVAQRVEALRVDLPRAHTWLEARDYDAVQEVVERLSAEADALDYAPVTLEVELLAGRLLLARGEVDAGQARLTKTYEQAVALGHDRAAVEAAARLAVGEAVYRARLREGLTWAETAVAVAGRLGSDGEAEALARDALGRVLRVSGRYEESIAAHTQALEIRERVHGPERLVTVMTRHRLGYALTVGDRPLEALEHLDVVLQILERSLGGHHPEVAAVLLTRAMALSERGRYDEAEASFLRALRIHEATLAPDDPALAYVPMMLGNLYREREEPTRALPHHQRALEVREAAYGPEDPRVALALGAVAADYHKLGQLEDAERLYRRALRIRQAALEDDDPNIASSLNNLATVLTDQDRLDEAAGALTDSVARYERARGPEHPTLASPLTNLGRLRRAQGRPEEAEALHRRALRLRLGVHGPEHMEVASVQFNLAGALLDQERYDEAVTLLDTCVTTVDHAVGAEHESLTEPLRELARAQLGLGRFEEARRTLDRARPLWVTRSGEDSEAVEQIDALLEQASAG